MNYPCEHCAYYVFDEESESYVCDVMLDEDELARQYSDRSGTCRYFREYDEYKLVRRQN